MLIMPTLSRFLVIFSIHTHYHNCNNYYYNHHHNNYYHHIYPNNYYHHNYYHPDNHYHKTACCALPMEQLGVGVGIM